MAKRGCIADASGFDSGWPKKSVLARAAFKTSKLANTFQVCQWFVCAPRFVANGTNFSQAVDAPPENHNEIGRALKQFDRVDLRRGVPDEGPKRRPSTRRRAKETAIDWGDVSGAINRGGAVRTRRAQQQTDSLPAAAPGPTLDRSCPRRPPAPGTFHPPSKSLCRRRPTHSCGTRQRTDDRRDFVSLFGW